MGVMMAFSPLYSDNFLGWGEVQDQRDLDNDPATDRMLIFTWLAIEGAFDQAASYPLPLLALDITPVADGGCSTDDDRLGRAGSV